ncbi:MFS transporter [Enterococcus phoeniculicola]|jgi:MFS family permease|uniref:Major facilitator superfamily (MFS) profile domain-containing protein n=1 Tax=Enterococcus phoeniculicola ATCC BAA-412 TaxID=1158610 RepID=R3TKY6_9ENTE|nr:MFS transporter [Enterococcus phoeniculicola]EOL41723.1 hypothetical protein UC3_03288 [Enterococcus phoeniculicola ATCC BAA-412]EOT78783.1 hypothetical protein I589_00288 [Enterococcus phoeniculicola ATCC BAA-412]
MKFFSMKLMALLSVALIVNSAPAISANIPAIMADYSEINPVYVGLLTTIPSLFLVIGIFLTNVVEKKLGAKNTILVGLAMVSIFGTLPAWYQGHFWVLFASRCLLGLGIGLFNRLMIQMISQLYQTENDKKAKALGLESAFEGLGGIFMTVGVGQLVRISWERSFLVYGVALIGFICIALFIPQKASQQKEEVSELSVKMSKEKKRKILLLGSVLFWIVLLFINYNLQITPLLIEQEIGDATAGSNMIAAIATGAFIAGNLFGFTFKWLNQWLLPIAACMAGASIYLSSQSTSLIFSLICSFALGFFFRNIMPYFMHTFTSGGQDAAKFGTTVVLVAYNLGATMAPYASQVISYFSGQTSAGNQMTIIGITLFGIGLFSLATNRFIKIT